MERQASIRQARMVSRAAEQYTVELMIDRDGQLEAFTYEDGELVEYSWDTNGPTLDQVAESLA